MTTLTKATGSVQLMSSICSTLFPEQARLDW
jgi:hypothetical protein